jgi:hypothetical protein
MLKPIPGENKGIVAPPTQSAKETAVPGAVKDINQLGFLTSISIFNIVRNSF